MDNELLYKYLKCRTTPQEEERIADWLEADPAHIEKFRKMRLQMETMAIAAPVIDSYYEKDRRKTWKTRMASWCAAAATIAAIICGTAWITSEKTRIDIGKETQVIRTGNAPVHLTLADGSSVWLNAKTELEYPAVFTGKSRSIRIDGEAMFDVTHDEDRPFIVETFACDVQVLGTNFNVIAEEKKGRFSTALFEGCVSIRNRSNEERIILNPDMVANLENGRLQTKALAGRDEYLWTEGIMSFGTNSFEEIIEKLEKHYGVTVVMRREDYPEVRYERLKIRISEGVEHALKVLQLASDFSYEYDPENSTITIK